MTDAILLKDLVKNYDSKEAVKSVNLRIAKGSIFGLLGPNGAGKSTIINIIAGIIKKTSGSISIMGIDIDENPRLTKYHIGVVPQEIVLDTFFTIRESLELQAGYYGIRPENRQTDKIIKALGLEDKANARSRQLSGGMKRRFLVAKSMVHSPDILILDEPTAGVDITLRDQLWDYVKELNKKGTTIILTTHYLKEAQELCDQIAFINHGKIVKCDYKKNLLADLSGKKVTVELDKPMSMLPNSLSDLNIVISGEKTIIANIEGKMPVGSLIKAVQSSGYLINDITIAEEDLETIFKKVVSS